MCVKPVAQEMVQKGNNQNADDLSETSTLTCIKSSMVLL